MADGPVSDGQYWSSWCHRVSSGGVSERRHRVMWLTCSWSLVWWRVEWMITIIDHCWSSASFICLWLGCVCLCVCACVGVCVCVSTWVCVCMLLSPSAVSHLQIFPGKVRSQSVVRQYLILNVCLCMFVIYIYKTRLDKTRLDGPRPQGPLDGLRSLAPSGLEKHQINPIEFFIKGRSLYQ